MAIRNLMEDVVASVVMEVLAKEGNTLNHPDVYYDDIIAYVLNRVPAKYITSERGILHDRIDSRTSVQQRSDILFLTHEAIEFIKNRRAGGQASYGDVANRALFFPHIIGEVLEETSFNPVEGVMITLLYKGKPAAMIDGSWSNPYRTMKATRGFYHFWPDFVEGEMKKGKHVEFTLQFSHPKLREHEVAIRLDVMEKFNLNNSHVVPITLIQTREGVDVSFLYEQE
ncbi:MAG: late competence development ComFB family protein [Spirochaetes bacterium]|nr:late competence development ComFB family protein [Spirochaetota bacterium]HPA73546.1 late competence development ComFB family protein [Spirochaetota bacterium]